jgi:hypothetical protein
MINIKTQVEILIKDLAGLSNIQDNILLDNIEQLYHNPYETSKVQILVRLKTSSKLSNSINKYILLL